MIYLTHCTTDADTRGRSVVAKRTCQTLRQNLFTGGGSGQNDPTALSLSPWPKGVKRQHSYGGPGGEVRSNDGLFTQPDGTTQTLQWLGSIYHFLFQMVMDAQTTKIPILTISITADYTAGPHLMMRVLVGVNWEKYVTIGVVWNKNSIQLSHRR